MSHINASVAYNTSVPCRLLDAYSVTLGVTDKPYSNTLESSSLVFCNWTHYERTTAAAHAKYDRATAAAQAEYDRVTAATWAQLYMAE